MSKNTLVIGTYISGDADSYDWWQKLPNVAEYDTIILDTTRIFGFMANSGRLEHTEDNIYAIDSEENEAYKQISANLDLVRNKIIEKLEFESTFYALYLPERIINYHPFHADYGGKGYLGLIRTNDWCPVSIKIVQETGKFIKVVDESYQDYFRDFKEWQYYFESKSLEVTDMEEYYSDNNWNVSRKLKPIAINKVERPIAIEVVFSFFKYGGFQILSEKNGGKLVLLPVANQYDTNACVSYLIQRHKQYEQTPPPVWINQIEIPGETSLKEDVENKKHQLEIIESEVKESERSLGEFTKHKDILYETGIPLQELVKSTLDKMGINVKLSIVTDEFIIEINSQEALVEVKGNVKSITKDDVAQLVTDLMEHLKKTGQEIRGLMIGNGWRLHPPEQRGVGNRPIFSRDAVKVAENHNIGLLSTTELFRAYCQVLEDPESRERILETIVNGVGVLEI